MHLHWELTLPPHILQDASDRSVKRNFAQTYIIEGTNERAYLHSLTALTAIYCRYIKLVHFDGKLLHIFMDNKFSKTDGLQMRRIFTQASGIYLPDTCMHDILRSKQALFTTREVTEYEGEAGVLESKYLGLKSWEGPVDYTEIRSDLVAVGIVDLSTTCLVYEVEDVEESIYVGSIFDPLETLIMANNGKVDLVDTMVLARQMSRNPFMLNNVIGKVEAYAKKH